MILPKERGKAGDVVQKVTVRAQNGLSQGRFMLSAGRQAMTFASILWRRRDRPGHEAAHLRAVGAGWVLAGCAAFAHDGSPCHLAYEVVCDAAWRTVSTTVDGWVGSAPVNIRIDVNGQGRWRLNGAECPPVEGGIDVDLNFSPSTNLLPIRRLGLAVGQEARVRAAWLRFPGFTLEPLDQVYRRTGPSTYRYASHDGRFVRDLEVSEAGFVMDYPDVWSMEAGG
jgi:hypothetical protein